MSKRLQRIQNWEALATLARFEPSTMAAHCSISLRQMERFFAEEFHETPRQWAVRLKCSRARDLISQGYSNKAVVAELGFSTQTQFCHQFKRVYGASPQSFAPPHRNGAS